MKEFIAMISDDEEVIAKTKPIVMGDRKEFIQHLAKHTPSVIALSIALGVVKFTIQERDLDLSIVE